jgi:azurin
MPKNIMAHNFVVLKKTADVNAFVTNANTANTTGYMPPDLKIQVIASSGLSGNGETTEVTFKSPAAAGSYPYLCTFPGHHAAGMKARSSSNESKRPPGVDGIASDARRTDGTQERA